MANPEWTEPESWYEAQADPVARVIRAGDTLYRHIVDEIAAKVEWDRAVHALAADAPAAMPDDAVKIDEQALASVIHDTRWNQGRAASSWVPFDQECESAKIYSLRIANAVKLHLASHPTRAGAAMPDDRVEQEKWQLVPTQPNAEILAALANFTWQPEEYLAQMYAAMLTATLATNAPDAAKPEGGA